MTSIYCAGDRPIRADSFECSVATVKWTDTPVIVDGLIDEPIWQKTTAYPLSLSRDRYSNGEVLVEQGKMWLAWDGTYLYAAFEFVDSDVVEEGDIDQRPQHTTGDVAELFLKPEDETWYWEFHVTPRGRKSSFFFPGKGRMGLPGCLDYRCGMIVAARVGGTLNTWQDRDRGWTAEMAIPLRDLIVQGKRFDSGSRWRILFGRYNYSRYLPEKELSAFPALPKTNFHDLLNYAELKIMLCKKENTH